MGIIRDTFNRIRAKSFGVMGQYNLVPPVLADGECCILQVAKNGNLLISVAEGLYWTPLVGGTDYDTQAPSSSTITFGDDYTNEIKAGMPVRVLDRTGVEYNDTNSQLSTYSGITGFTSRSIDSRGRIYISIIDDTGGFFHIEIYNRSTRLAGDLVAHTATYNSTGAKALVADNASPFGGAITVDAIVAADATIYVEFYKWFVCTSMTTILMSLRGPALDTTAGRISELWYGQPSQVVNIGTFICGYYAQAGATNILLATQLGMRNGIPWLGPPLRIVGFDVTGNGISATPAKVNVNANGSKVSSSNGSDGLTISVGGVKYKTVVDINPTATAIEYDNFIEWTTTAGGVVAPLDSDLNTAIVAVLE